MFLIQKFVLRIKLLRFKNENINIGKYNFKMSKLHKKTGSKCIICDELLDKNNSINFHKTRRQTHSLCIDCGIGYLSPLLTQATNNIRKNLRNGVVKCPGSIYGEHRNMCKFTTNFSCLNVPECEISLDLFRLNYVLNTPNRYICPEMKCGQVVDVDPGYIGNNLVCYTCKTTWCRQCIISPYHMGKSCIEEEADNKNTDNGKLIWELKNEGKLKFCPVCRSPCIKENGCFLADVTILIWNGQTKKAKDIMIGDELIGDDGNKRTVYKIFNGIDQMYKIHQDKANDYTVSGNHILVLKAILHKYVYNIGNKWKVKWFDHNDNKYRINTFNLECDANIFCNNITNDDIVNITVLEYLKLSKTSQKYLVGFRSVGVNWEEKHIKIDPYILGTWLSNNRLLNKQPDNDLLKYYNLIDYKHIPQDYLVNDRSIRLSLLAGIIDSNGFLSNSGKRVIIVQTDKYLSRQILLLCRSLGFMTTYRTEKRSNTNYPYLKNFVDCNNFYILNILGEKLSNIPTRIKRKKCVDTEFNKNYLTSSINITNIGEEKYYGWVVDGNHKFIMSDFTVIHNCNKMVCVSCGSKWCWLCEKHNIDYDHYNSDRIGACNGKLWQGSDINGNAFPDIDINHHQPFQERMFRF